MVYNGMTGTQKRLCRSEDDVRAFCRLAGVEMLATWPGYALRGTEEEYRPEQMTGMMG